MINMCTHLTWWCVCVFVVWVVVCGCGGGVVVGGRGVEGWVGGGGGRGGGPWEPVVQSVYSRERECRKEAAMMLSQHSSSSTLSPQPASLVPTPAPHRPHENTDHHLRSEGKLPPTTAGYN